MKKAMTIGLAVLVVLALAALSLAQEADEQCGRRYTPTPTCVDPTSTPQQRDPEPTSTPACPDCPTPEPVRLDEVQFLPYVSRQGCPGGYCRPPWPMK